MPARPLVVVGASAGGVEALMQLVAALPADLPAAVCVVVHQPSRTGSLLPQVLARAGPLPAVLACDGQELRAGTIYVAPPDAHLMVEAGRLRLRYSPRENGHRPAIDPLFRTAAHAYGSSVIGVLLSGADDDGTEGLLTIKARGGRALVQDPREALYPRMPASAKALVAVDATLPAAALAQEIVKISALMQERDEFGAMQTEFDPERDRERLMRRVSAWDNGEPADSASGFSCPLCGGGIWMGAEGPLTRFRCHTGHEFSRDTFLQEQAAALETTLWQAVRTLHERAGLLQRMAHQQEGTVTSARFAEQADDLHHGVEMLRQLLQNNRLTLSHGEEPD